MGLGALILQARAGAGGRLVTSALAVLGYVKESGFIGRQPSGDVFYTT